MKLLNSTKKRPLKKSVALSAITYALAMNAYAEISTPVFGVLDNGLSYAIVPLHDEKGRLDIRLRVNAGAVDETDSQTGVAHMVEHLVFRATDKYPDGMMDYLHKTGWGRAKNYNAVTTSDSTTYMLSPPPSVGLDGSLGVLSQMAFFATLSDDDLNRERQIITEEWRGNQGVAARMNAQRTQSVRAGSRYARNPVIGTYESIQHMPASELQAFYHTWYTPSNMQLLIVGDVNIDTAKSAIATHFGMTPSHPLPSRDYYEPALDGTRHISQLQDDKSGVSQVAYIFRLHDFDSRSQDETGRKNRLIGRLAAAIIAERLKNEQKNLPKGVNSLVVKKSDIGKATVAIGIFSSVDKDGHRAGLSAIFDEIARLKAYPVMMSELDAQRAKLQSQINTAKDHTGDRDFAGWVNAMNTTFLNGIPYRSQPEIAALSEPLLHAITPSDIDQKIHAWLSAPDTIVQYQAPHATIITPFSESEVATLEQRSAQKKPTPPTPARAVSQKELSLDTLIDKEQSAHTAITSSQYYKDEKVTYFYLSNGDTVVYLQSDLAKTPHLKAISRAGYLTDTLPSWQSQVAMQLAAQNAPFNWSDDEYKSYKSRHKLSLSLKQTESDLTIDGSGESMDEIVKAYLALILHTPIRDGYDDVKTELLNNLNSQTTQNHSLDERYRQALSTLRYGTAMPDKVLPTADELEQGEISHINHAWQQISHAPTTFFVIGKDTPDAIAHAISPLAHIRRTPLATKSAPKASTGTATTRLAYNVEPKSDVSLYSFSEMAWSGADAMMVSAIKDIAATRLKTALRDNALGIYRLKFDSTLNPKTERIESELTFSTDPAKADALVALAKTTLVNLAATINENDIALIKRQFVNAERTRLANSDTWLNRLILSHEHDGTPHYLSQMTQMADSITLSHAKAIAQKMYNSKNVKVFIATPLAEPPLTKAP